MKTSSNVVSIHPYFKANPGQLEAFKALLPKFIEKTAGEKDCLYYDFTVSGDEIHCREAYVGAAGVLAHLENVGDLLGQAMELAELTRLEFHGPADELKKLKEPMAAFNPSWYEYQCGLR